MASNESPPKAANVASAGEPFAAGSKVYQSWASAFVSSSPPVTTWGHVSVAACDPVKAVRSTLPCGVSGRLS